MSPLAITWSSVILQGYASQDHHWPSQTSHARWCYWQHNVHHSISRLFHACHMFSGWTSSHLWREQGTNCRPANSGVLWQMPIELHGAGLWAQVPLEDIGPSWRLFLTVWCQKHAPVACRTGKELIPVLLLGWCPSTAMSSSPCVTAGLLVSPPCSWDCTGRHSKSSWRSWTTRAIWLGFRYRLMLPVVTRTLAEHKTKEELVRKDKERAAVSGQYCTCKIKTTSFWGILLLHWTCYCHCNLHQSRWKWFIITCAS